MNKRYRVHDILHIYSTGEDITFGKWKLDTAKGVPGLLYWIPGFKHQHIHFYRDSRTGLIKAHIKNQKTGEMRPFKGSLTELKVHLTDRFMNRERLNRGELPYGFIKTIQKGR